MFTLLRSIANFGPPDKQRPATGDMYGHMRYVCTDMRDKHGHNYGIKTGHIKYVRIESLKTRELWTFTGNLHIRTEHGSSYHTG